MLRSRRSRGRHGHHGCFCCYDFPIRNRTLRQREKRAWRNNYRKEH